jgi:hypothetical protein
MRVLVPASAMRSDFADPGKEESGSPGGTDQSYAKPDLCRFGRRGCLRGRRHVLPAGGRVPGALGVGDGGSVRAVGILRGLVRSRIAALAVLLRPAGGRTGLSVRLCAGRRTGGIRGSAARGRSARRRDGTLGSRALRCCALGCRAARRRRRGPRRRRSRRRGRWGCGRWGWRRSRRGGRS